MSLSNSSGMLLC